MVFFSLGDRILDELMGIKDAEHRADDGVPGPQA